MNVQRNNLLNSYLYVSSGFIDFANSHVWDHSAVNAIAKVILKYQQLDKVTIIGLNEESELLVERIGLYAPIGH